MINETDVDFNKQKQHQQQQQHRKMLICFAWNLDGKLNNDEVENVLQYYFNIVIFNFVVEKQR